MAGMYPNNQDIEIFNEQVSWPGVDASGKFTNGSFNDPMVKASFIPADTINLILDNLESLIKKCGGAPNATGASQIADLLSHLAEAKKIVVRDNDGRARVAAPVAPDDIARLAEVTAAIEGAAAGVQKLREETAAQIEKMQAAQTGYALYEGGRNLMAVYGTETVPDLMAILREKCNGTGRPDFDGLFVGDYVDIPSLIINDTTYANQRILLSGFNHYKNPYAPEGCRNPQNHILFTFDKIVMRQKMNASNINAGGYPNSALRTFLEGLDGTGSGLFAQGLKEALGDYLYTVKKFASIKGGMAWGNYTVFPPTALEVAATVYYVDGSGEYRVDDENDTEGLQRKFPIFNVRRSRKLETGQPATYNSWYWLSSPYAGSSSAFSTINNYGLSHYHDASGAGGVAPAFCVA